MPNKRDRADIEVGAAFKAKKLRFERVPETEVHWHGDSETVSERKNLPEEVEPGVTYRDVEVRWQSQAWAEVRELIDEIEERKGRKGR